jgi:hypothetical protein
MKVIFGYWEANKDGKVDDMNAWNTMWDKIISDYGSNGNVYFEPMNEPFGYSLNDWVSLCSSWLSRHSSTPRGRVLISGTGYNDNVTGVGAASALNGTLASAPSSVESCRKHKQSKYPRISLPTWVTKGQPIYICSAD